MAELQKYTAKVSCCGEMKRIKVTGNYLALDKKIKETFNKPSLNNGEFNLFQVVDEEKLFQISTQDHL